MLDNLLTNAIRDTPTGGEVTVAVTTGEGIVECKVSDSGPGFPADQLQTVFDRFTKSGDSGGSCLGLGERVDCSLGAPGLRPGAGLIERR